MGRNQPVRERSRDGVSPAIERTRRRSMELTNQVAIVGTGTIKFGENFHQSTPTLSTRPRSWR
jgi:hypothetical protein